MARQTERDTLHAQTLLKRRRLAVLERQAAQYGIDAPPQVVTEIEDLRKEIAGADAMLNPPLGVPRHVWDGLDADQQRTYLTSLVMQLQADFTQCQFLMFRRLKWLIVAVALSQLVTIAIAVAR